MDTGPRYPPGSCPDHVSFPSLNLFAHQCLCRPANPGAGPHQAAGRNPRPASGNNFQADKITFSYLLPPTGATGARSCAFLWTQGARCSAYLPGHPQGAVSRVSSG